MKNYLKLLILVLSITLFPNISTSGHLSLIDNKNFIEEKSSIDYLKKWKVDNIKRKISEYLYEYDTSLYYRNLNDEHLLIMDSLVMKYRIPEDIYYRQIFKESWYIADIESKAGAVGYSQIMYRTYLSLKDTLNLTDPNRLDVNENLLTGAYYMRYLKDKIDNTYPDYSEYDKWIYTLASYNGGFGRHKIALKKFKETKGYVKFIMGYRNRKKI